MASDPDTKALWQRLDTLIKDADTTQAKAVAAQRRVQATRLLLEEEQATATDVKWKATAAKGLLPASSSSSTMSDMVDVPPATRHSSPTSTSRPWQF
jgi:hypothetical protein